MATKIYSDESLDQDWNQVAFEKLTKKLATIFKLNDSDLKKMIKESFTSSWYDSYGDFDEAKNWDELVKSDNEDNWVIFVRAFMADTFPNWIFDNDKKLGLHYYFDDSSDSAYVINNKAQVVFWGVEDEFVLYKPTNGEDPEECQLDNETAQAIAKGELVSDDEDEE